MRASWTGSAALAISISFRTAASGSLNGLGSANFTGFVLGCDMLTACRIFDGANVNRARKLARRNTMASALNATFQHRDRRSTDTGRYPGKPLRVGFESHETRAIRRTSNMTDAT